MKVLAALFVGLAGQVIAGDWQVTVGISQNSGQVGLGFDPNRIVPAAGDSVIFSFAIPSYISSPKMGTYSATQGSFATPCQPLAGGFDTGPQTTSPENQGTANTYSLLINDTQPLYFYSSVDAQCQGGMVLGVNTPATGDGSIDAYASAAANAPVGATSTAAPSASSSTAAGSSASSGTASSSASSSSATKTGGASRLHPGAFWTLAGLAALL